MKQQWAVLEIRDVKDGSEQVHVVPCNDSMAHNLETVGELCPCIPRLEVRGTDKNWPMWVHRSLAERRN